MVSNKMTKGKVECVTPIGRSLLVFRLGKLNGSSKIRLCKLKLIEFKIREGTKIGTQILFWIKSDCLCQVL